MEHVRILALNLAAVLFSTIQGLNPYLQTISLILAITYTVVKLMKEK